MRKEVKFSDLVGKVLVSILNDTLDIITFETESEKYQMYHDQDCCESVEIEDISGDLNDLLNSPILMAEEVSNKDKNADESGTWTFYKLATIHGSVTIRWYGASSGYYSESVSFYQVPK